MNPLICVFYDAAHMCLCMPETKKSTPCSKRWVEPAMVSRPNDGCPASRERAGCRTGRVLTLNPTVDGQNLVNQLGWFKFADTVVHIVDGRIPAPPGMYKPCKQWDKLPISWCRISSINSRSYINI